MSTFKKMGRYLVLALIGFLGGFGGSMDQFEGK